MAVVICMATAFLQGMEKQNSVTLLADKTMVWLTQGCMYDFDRTVDIMVVGENEQRIVKGISMTNAPFVGCVGEVRNKNVYIKNKGNDSSSCSDDDNSSAKKISTLSYDGPTKELLCRVISVIEPCYVDSPHQVLSGNEAMVAIKKDLARCYDEAFSHVRKGETSVVIPVLGVGIPIEEAASVAVAAIFACIRTTTKHPYSLIHLVVKKQSVFDLCKTFLLDAYKEFSAAKRST